MAHGINVRFDTARVLHPQDPSWKLSCTAYEAQDTDGEGTDDSAIFVMQLDRSGEDSFVHIATPTDMNELPSDPALVAPKRIPYYRTTYVDIIAKSFSLLSEFKDAIEKDISLLITSLDIKDQIATTEEVSFGIPSA